MVRAVPGHPAVPRRSKIVADAWDQEAFDAERNEHSVTLRLPADEMICIAQTIQHTSARRAITPSRRCSKSSNRPASTASRRRDSPGPESRRRREDCRLRVRTAAAASVPPRLPPPPR